MIFTVSKSSDWSGDKDKDVEINNLDDLQKLQESYVIEKNGKKINPSLIIDFKSKTIEVYDSYRE